MAVQEENDYICLTYCAAAQANQEIRAQVDELTSTAGPTAAVVCPQRQKYGIKVVLSLFGTCANGYASEAIKIDTSFRNS